MILYFDFMILVKDVMLAQAMIRKTTVFDHLFNLEAKLLKLDRGPKTELELETIGSTNCKLSIVSVLETL